MGNTTNYQIPYPEQHDIPDGAGQMKAIADKVDSVVFANARVVTCVVYQTVVQALPNQAWTALTFDAEHYDTDAMHSTTTQNSRIVIPVSGTYLLVGGVAFAFNATGRRGAQWAVGGVANAFGALTMLPTLTAAGSNPALAATSLPLRLTAGQYVELQAFQDTGAALNTLVLSSTQPYAGVLRLSP